MRVVPADVFTTAEAREAGWTDSALLCAVQAGRLARLRRGVYARADTGEPLQVARAAALAHPGLPLSHLSALRLSDVPVVGRHAVLPEVTVPPRSNADLPGVHPYRARVREHELRVVDGVLTLSAARTVIDVARHYPLITAVAALDHVLHQGLATADEVLDVMEFCARWPGARRARRALALCDSRAESPLESVSRLVMLRLRLPAPEPQVIILNESGGFVGRADFYWDEFRVVGEADGLAKYTADDSMDAQNDREQLLRDCGLEVVRWGWRRVWRDAPVFAPQVGRVLTRGRARDGRGEVRRWQAVSTARVILA